MLAGMSLAAGGPLPTPRNTAGPYLVCCVCAGNIYRSPTAVVVQRTQFDPSWLAERDLVLPVDAANLATPTGGSGRFRRSAIPPFRSGNIPPPVSRLRQQ